LSSNAWRYGGLVALGAFTVGAVVLHNGAGKRVTERFTAVAIDGDSLRSAGNEIRLYGIDAPELSQTCRDAHGGEWACGRQAHAHLHSIVSRGTLTCTPNGTDRYRRTLATCSAGPVADIGDAMVRAGFAVSLSAGYWAAELEARYNKRGIWRGTFDRPQEWRRRYGRR
jgi:endonuclease YncB( thermonuclease family)